jgi:hypothetical protein
MAFEGFKAKVAALTGYFNTVSDYTRAGVKVAKDNAPVAIGAGVGLAAMFLFGEGLVASLILGGGAGFAASPSGRDWIKFGASEVKAQLDNARKSQKRLPPPGPRK